jgi:tRNA G18 (ribose-2'-O)-methylase SpoU
MVPKRLSSQRGRAQPVADPSDPRVRDFFRLSDPELRRRREQPDGDPGFFVAEGTLVIRQLLRSPYPVRSVLVTPKGLAALEGDLAGCDAPVFLVDQPVMESIAGFRFHRGALASAARRRPDGLDEVVAGADLVVVAEGVNDNENLGALFRNAAAFGARALVLDAATADPLYRRSIRVSMGHALRTPFARVDDASSAVERLRASGYEVLALTPAADAEDLRTVPVRSRQALLVGAEGPGLSAHTMAAADRRVRIRMAAEVDSLNVATAAAIALHHLARPG